MERLTERTKEIVPGSLDIIKAMHSVPEMSENDVMEAAHKNAESIQRRLGL